MCFKRNFAAGSKDGKEKAKMSTHEEFIMDILVRQTTKKLDGPLFNELLKTFTHKAAKRKTFANRASPSHLCTLFYLTVGATPED
jgi:hypothetical protein